MAERDEELARLVAALEVVESRLEELSAVVGAVHSDQVARAQAVAEDGLARADHALERADDALARAESLGADGLARADHALAKANDAVARAESLGSDGIARADHALERADDAVARAESLGADGLARADHALERAGDALARSESLGADALARADHALARAEDALARANYAATAGEHAVQVVGETMLPARMAALVSWLELRPPAEDMRVSVVLATRDRPALLRRAIDSVLAQCYPRWQLVVVDDGTSDGTATVLTEIDDDRVVAAAGPRRGLGAARNTGLDRAEGEVVCYLDDDNVMHPRWLQAVVHVFAGRDDVDVGYGVTVAEHRVPGSPNQGDWWPTFWQLPWSRETLLRENVTDAGALAHRRKLPGARFDEGMGEDWDLLIRLTEDRPALAIPAISHAYAIEGDDHMSRKADHRAALEEVRRRHAPGWRP